MKTAGLLAVFASVSMLAQACPPDPKPPGPDASDASPQPQPSSDAAPAPTDAGPKTPCAAACDVMHTLGCADQKPNCATTCEAALAARQIRGLDPSCVAKCTSKACVRVCGAATPCP